MLHPHELVSKQACTGRDFLYVKRRVKLLQFFAQGFERQDSKLFSQTMTHKIFTLYQLNMAGYAK